jgi:hypothetical protein
MFNSKRKILRVGSCILLSIVLLALAYAYERSKFIQKTNALFDPKEKAFSGIFIPWPIGSPTLLGNLDPKTDSRVRASLGYDSGHGSINTNGMSLSMHDSDGTFFVRAN